MQGEREPSTGMPAAAAEPAAGPPVVRVGGEDSDRLDRSRRLGWVDPALLARSTVLLAGCGALGNEAAKDLVLAGVGALILCDPDVVVESNRNRCVLFTADDARRGRRKVDAVADGVRRLVPEVQVRCEPVRLEDVPESVFRSATVVLGCLDQVGARLALNARCAAAGLPLVDGGTLGMSGKVQVVIPPLAPCVECTANRSHLKVLERRQSCTGGDTTYYEPPLPAEVTTTAVVAAVQVREAMKILHGRRDDAIRHVFYYDGMRNRTEVWEAEVAEGCPHHGSAPVGPAALGTAREGGASS